MPWLPIYGTNEDLAWIQEVLNADAEIAFIVGTSPRKWKAIPEIVRWEARNCLWHTPSGALPLVRRHFKSGRIDDPWAGWKEKVTRLESTSPYFGAGWPGVIWFNARPVGDSTQIGLSSFEWIGNRYRAEGYPANIETEKWWKRFGRMIRKQCKKTPRVDGMKPEIWALPVAHERISNGATREINH